MTSRNWIGVLLLVVWVLLGPVTMAFGDCALMGAMCEGYCGASSCALLATNAWTEFAPTSFLYVVAESRSLSTTLSGLDHPPKSLICSA
jgi:hypothetical protein